MTDQFLAEIRIVPFNFAPNGWAMCDGQLMSIQQNTALFSLLGTTYGGNGVTNFALPNLQGSVPMHPNSGAGGLSVRFLGESGGEDTVALLTSELPLHPHALKAVSSPATSPDPENAVLAQSPDSLAYGTGSTVLMAPDALAATGSGQPHNNMQPYLTLTFVIALTGIFPPRS
ncbi:MAG: Tail Collar domain protein [Acidimicrobiales bacterium]|nr:Tail Collar domain protein [Acidimicrobiales bacterium]